MFLAGTAIISENKFSVKGVFMQKTLAEIAADRGFSSEHINKLIHHVASEKKRTWAHTRNVFTGKSKGKQTYADLQLAMLLPEAQLTGHVSNKSGSEKIPCRMQTTPCRCVTCGRKYKRFIFWTGTLPARIRCTECNALLGIKDYCEVFAW